MVLISTCGENVRFSEIVKRHKATSHVSSLN